MWPWGDRVGRTTLYEAFKTACKKLEKLGKTFEALQQRKAGEQAGEESPALAANLAQIRNVSLVRRGRGLVPAEAALEQNQ